MAFTSLSLDFSIVESADAISFIIKDTSTGWNDETDDIDSAYLKVYKNGTLIKTVNMLPVIDDYLGDGYEINAADIDDSWELFEDQYYAFVLSVDDGLYADGEEPTKQVDKAFLAQNYFKYRRVGALIEYPDFDYEQVQELFLLGLYFEAADQAATDGLDDEFDRIITYMNTMFDKYEISSVL